MCVVHVCGYVWVYEDRVCVVHVCGYVWVYEDEDVCVYEDEGVCGACRCVCVLLWGSILTSGPKQHKGLLGI